MPTLGEDDIILFVSAVKDVLLPVIYIALSWIQIKIYSKSITSPITDLSNATMLIASGDFDTVIDEGSTFREIAVLQSNFNIMAKDLRNNELLKKDFVTNVSHEFKTPLSIIKGYSDVLCDKNISEEKRIEYAKMISQESERLLHLTSNVLRMSKLNNQEILVSPVSFSLDEQIRRMVLMLEKKWSEKDIELDIELNHVTVSGDEELLSQVWLNLFDNAIKFSKQGGTIKLTLDYGEHNTAVVHIIDNGIGMTKEDCTRIFDQFYQADVSHSKAGNGLGLTIVQRIITLHKGTIDVTSELGNGSDFKVVIPVNMPALSE